MEFFATAYGKNACDGIGDTTKRKGAKKSLQIMTCNQILTAKEIFNCSSEYLKGIKYIYDQSEEIMKHELT